MKLTWFVLLSLPSLLISQSAGAQPNCDTTGTDKAYGDFWVERASGSCNCEVKQRKYDCVASGGYRAEGSVEVVATVTGGSCAVPCELTSGYDSAVAVAIGNWTRPRATTSATPCSLTMIRMDMASASTMTMTIPAFG